MITALWTAVSGMSANGTTLSVVGDNIANMNTTAFKSNRATFSDVLSATISGASSSNAVGRGTQLEAITPLLTQGSLISTGNPLDLAIDGNGYFMVKDSNGTYYTRAGNFSLDKDGYLVTAAGMKVQGYMNTGTGTTGSLGDIRADSSANVAKATTTVNLNINLNSTASNVTAAFTLDGNGDGIKNDPANYNFSSTVTVYDSHGASHEVTAYYAKSGANSWKVYYATEAVSNPGTLVLATASSPQILTFNTSGVLVSDGVSGASNEPAIKFNFGSDVVSTQNIKFDYGTSLSQGGTGLRSSSQLADASQVLTASQDGNASGVMKGLSIDEAGVIYGVFTNGQNKVLGTMALTKFAAPDKLAKMGQNLLRESNTSGQPVTGTPKTSGMGRVLSGSLEQSNVDLAAEFVTMISAQRAFQANSRTVTTVDDMMQEVLALKR
ncbi:flagellar hook protein FlgE [Candidatus Magnetobacterium casense]|uniref:flagellar hook protein FlgE n=1 Tax=Candidatus Magnetobacterium casense TaxID=1455061 RepID=UPI00058ACF62|nr:flagellar hook protein FlgE [Candidatus Magnetobacterium casensis]